MKKKPHVDIFKCDMQLALTGFQGKDPARRLHVKFKLNVMAN